MNSAPLLVDPSTQSATVVAETQPFGDRCMLESLIRRPFCMNPQLQTHPYDRQPTTAPRLQMMPRRDQTQNPVIAELMSTVTRVRDRKRQRDEEAMYPRRSVGLQTDTEDVSEVLDGGTRISDMKRVRREELLDQSSLDGITFETSGTNTSDEPHSQIITSNSSSLPSTSASSSSDRPRAMRSNQEMRQARRARRQRQTQHESQRMQLEHRLQQITGPVPGSEHNCMTGCPHLHQQQQQQHQQPLLHIQLNPIPPQPQTGPNSVSPTIAPGAMLRAHPLASTFPYFSLPLTQNYPVMMVLPMAAVAQQHAAAAAAVVAVAAAAAVPQPPPPPPQPTLHAPVPIRPQNNPYNLYAFRNSPINVHAPGYVGEYVELFRSQQFLFPTSERYGIDRHHMFGGLDLDLPVGASKVEIDTFTIPTVYAKKTDGEEDEDTCTVCLSSFEDGESIQKLRCNHVFHPECIYKWLDINKRCPMCREEIDRPESLRTQPEYFSKTMPSWREKHEKIVQSKILVIGAGGIGCELLKNLAVTGFRKVHVIDLDTIDISNLNRQFLFRKEHVSSSKAATATQVVKQFCPQIELTFDHDSIFEKKYNMEFFQAYDIVLNALDNRAARNYVNRMCHAANRPLIDSGSGGYFGQVSVIMRGKTECYECVDKPVQQTTYPGCTIRNTPSEHIHCTVWAKHVFNQLFGEVDIDDDVSPDMDAVDPDNTEAVTTEKEKEAMKEEPAPVGTRQWAESVDYDAAKVFDKLFLHDIEYLCKMEHLWKQRKRPSPLEFHTASSTGGEPQSLCDAQRDDTSIWTLSTCAKVFSTCIQELLEQIRAEPDVKLAFDKDHAIIMSFVAACANIRAKIFGIPMKSQFDIKAMAGNIIPAIASTNAIVAGIIVTEAVRVIEGSTVICNSSIATTQSNPRGRIFGGDATNPPNPRCFVCSEKREVFIYVNPDTMTVGGLCEKVLKQKLNMLAPDVMDSATSRIIVSSDGDTDDLLPKKLAEVSIEDGAILSCDDFQQEMEIKLFIKKGDRLAGDDFEVARSEKEPEPDDRKRKADGSEEPEAKRQKVEEKDDKNGNEAVAEITETMA